MKWEEEVDRVWSSLPGLSAGCVGKPYPDAAFALFGIRHILPHGVYDELGYRAYYFVRRGEVEGPRLRNRLLRSLYFVTD